MFTNTHLILIEVAYRDYGLSYRSIASPVERDLMTVCRIWNRWIQEGRTEHHVGYQLFRSLNRIILIDLIAMSRALSQEIR